MLKALEGAINTVIKYSYSICSLHKSISTIDSTEVFLAQAWFCKHLKLEEDKAQYFQWPPIFPDVDNKLFESKSLIKVMNFVLEAQADMWENHSASKF